MSPFTAELLGTLFLILLGNGVVANILLHQTKGNNSGLIVVAFGWSIAVFVGVYTASHGSGAHLNPAVTLGLAVIGKFPWADVPLYIAAQFAGAMLGATGVWLTYRQHYDATDDPGLQLATFCNSPAIASTPHNLLTEMIGTFVLMMGVLFMTKPGSSLGTLDALPVALLVLGIGLSLGGPTGYAINPARDLGPRIMHALLPMQHKGSSNWKYSWIPVAGPVAGAVAAALLYHYVFNGN